MKGDSIVMHPILSKASLREPDTERLNTMLRVALTPFCSMATAGATSSMV